MKLILIQMALLCGVHYSSAATIEAGMRFSEATSVLKGAGSTPQQRSLDAELAEGLSAKYFPIDERVDLCVVFDTATEKIIGLSITFYPSYRPVKGLEVTKELSSISFDSVDTYTTVIRRAEQEAAGDSASGTPEP